MRAAALAALARGWSPIPALPRAKRPAIAWRAFESHRASADDIDHWYTHMPDANLAAVTGEISGLVVVDVDPAHGGTQSLEALEREHGAMPVTVESHTGGGGRHLYFAHPGGHVGNRVGLRPGIDVRGDGGCIILPPSIHPNGNRYTWVPGRSPEECSLAPLPACFREKAR